MLKSRSIEETIDGSIAWRILRMVINEIFHRKYFFWTFFLKNTALSKNIVKKCWSLLWVEKSTYYLFYDSCDFRQHCLVSQGFLMSSINLFELSIRSWSFLTNSAFLTCLRHFLRITDLFPCFYISNVFLQNYLEEESSLEVTNLRLDIKGSRFEFGCWLYAEVSSLQ